MRFRVLSLAAAAVLLVGVVLLVGRLNRPGATAPSGDSSPSRVLLIGVDGLDWHRVRALAADGRMPVLGGLMAEGASGPLRSIPPYSSPAVWTSIATGKAPQRHGICESGVYAGGGASAELAGSRAIRCMTLWEIAAAAGRTSGVVGWLVTYPPVPVTSYTVTFRAVLALSGDAPERAHGTERLSATVHPDGLWSEMESLRLSASGVPASEVAACLASGEHADDEDVNALTMELARWLAADRTVVAAARHLASTRPTELSAVYIRGNDIVSHRFWRYMDPESWTRGRPRPELVQTFATVVDAYYERVDGLVGELLEGADQRAAVIVCSDHGFVGHRGRAGFDGGVAIGTDMHGEEGTIIIRGPGVARGVELDGSSVLDVAPTVLALMGMPVGGDMDGRALVDAFEASFIAARPIRTVDTYDTDDRMVPQDDGESPVDDELRDLLKSLGYVK